MGGLTGLALTQMPDDVPEMMPGRVGSQAVRTVTPMEQYSKIALRRGMRGAAIGATGGALLALASQLRSNDPGEQNVYL